MKRTLIAIAATMFVASSASAVANYVLTTDSASYLVGQQITVTVTMTNAGQINAGGLQALGYTVGWNSDVAFVTNAGISSTFGNSAQAPILAGWAGSATPTCNSSGNQCSLITQTAPFPAGGIVPDGQVIVGTLILTADAEGLLNFSTVSIGNLGGTTDISGVAGVEVVPEPTTAALLGLGLLGLGIAGRRR